MILLISQVSTFHSFRWSIGCSQERGGGGNFLQIPIWQVCVWSSKVFGLPVLNMTGHLNYYFMCELSLSRVKTFLQSLLLKQLGLGSSLVKEKFSRKIPLTMSITRDTCWGNDTRYGCGLTMASFSQREVLRETSIIESNLSLFLFAYLKLLEISTINIFSCMNIRTQREYRVNLNSPSTLSNELKRTACAHNLQASKDDIHPSTSK